MFMTASDYRPGQRAKSAVTAPPGFQIPEPKFSPYTAGTNQKSLTVRAIADIRQCLRATAGELLPDVRNATKQMREAQKAQNN
jgi:hypothetical protein